MYTGSMSYKEKLVCDRFVPIWLLTHKARHAARTSVVESSCLNCEQKLIQGCVSMHAHVTLVMTHAGLPIPPPAWGGAP